MLSRAIQTSIPTPLFLRKQVQATECCGLIFETMWQDSVFFVGLGLGDIAERKIWMSEIAQMTLSILVDLPSFNKELTFSQIHSPLDIKRTLALTRNSSKIMFLGYMTEVLQNSILQELNAR